jgi:AIPR protein
MINETPIEILELPSQLTSMFVGKIPAAVTGDEAAKKSNFLSRALAAYAVHKLAGCSLNDAAGCVVDGGGDGGIDAIFYSATSATMFIVQSKYIIKGSGEPDLGDVTKFKTGLENVLQGNFEAFQTNQAWQKRLPEIRSQLERMIQVKPILVYSGINVVSEDRLLIFEDLKRRFADDDNSYIDLQICNLTRVHSWLVDTDGGLGIPEVELSLQQPGWLKKPYETVYGLLPLRDLADLYEQYGKKLIVANIRGYKGTTDVNAKILETIETEPEHFFYLNNGLTAYCDRLKVGNLDRGNTDSKKVTAFGLSIVNGAQTLGSIADFFKKNPESTVEGSVFIKIISLEKCLDDREFAADITRSTNFQNRINVQDFVSLDEQQERIANQLVLSEITYHYKDAADLPEPDESNFTMREAVTALACLVQKPDCDDFCARILANRASLWSMEEEAGLKPSIYERVFGADRSARTVWRAVQTQRIVMQVMKDNGKAETGVRKAFFENARWVLLHVVFIRCQSQQGQVLGLTEAEVGNVQRCAVELAEQLWTVCEDQGYVSRGSDSQVRHFRSVFSSAADCEQLRHGLLQALKNT